VWTGLKLKHGKDPFAPIFSGACVPIENNSILVFGGSQANNSNSSIAAKITILNDKEALIEE